MKTNPWFYIPSLYLAEGFPYVIMNTVSVLLYGALGYSNEQITLWTGWLYLPWVLKMFWSPLVDAYSTKRKWLLRAQMIMSLFFLAMGGFICINALWQAQQLNNLTFFSLSLVGFFIGAFASATLDIATDGYYLLALTPAQQGYFVGVRTFFFRVAMILGSGLLISLVGVIEPYCPTPYNWAVFFIVMACFFILCAFYHTVILPKPQEDKPVGKTQGQAWKESFGEYFTQKNILYILLFILLYRFGEALLEKIVPLFLLKPTAQGALGITIAQYGVIKGTLGLGAIIVGNLLGGWLLGKFGFKKCIWPFAIALVLPNLFYVYLATIAKPSLGLITALITVENFGYGLAMMALTVFIMYVSQGKYKTSHYAISTGIMALGMMVPSMLSGKMQALLGYKNFFWIAFLISLVTFAIVPLAFKIQALDLAESKQRGQV